MTYEDLYKPASQAYLDKWSTFYNHVPRPPQIPKNIIQLKDCLDTATTMLDSLKRGEPPEFVCDISAELDKRFDWAVSDYEAKQLAVKAKYSKMREDAQATRAEKVSAAEAKAAESVSGLTKKYDKLLTYKDKVAEAVIHYQVTPATMEIDTDSLTREEMEALLDTALKACSVLGEDAVRDKLKTVYTPPDDADEDTRLHHAVAVLAGAVILAPVALVLLFFYMYRRTASVYSNLDGLQIAEKLMYGINFARFRDDPKLEEIPDVNYDEITAAEEKELLELEKSNPAQLKAEIQDSINKNFQVISNSFQYVSSKVRAMRDELISSYEKAIAQYKKAIDDYMENLKPFGSEQNTSYVMSTHYVLGQKDGLIDIKYDMGMKNIIFANRTPEMFRFIKLLLSNALLNVRPKQLVCTIYDPEGLGAEFATFLSKETESYIHVVTKDFNKHLDALRAYSQNNLRILDQVDINTFNRESESKGMVTLEYHLLLIVSGVDKPTEDANLVKFMQFSARTGAMVWLISPLPVSDCIFYDQPFGGVEAPYPVTPEVFTRVSATYLEAFNTLKDSGIEYLSAFADKYLPREKWWTENTDKGIKLNFGLQDGDPSKGYAIELGDANVHGLCVGATGAGKSAFNNQLILSLITRYPPSALELVMVDFKNVEFSMLTDSTTHISRIPHAKVIAGTKDGEYAISIFDYLIGEMDRRTKLFTEVGVKKIEEYNKKMRSSNQVNKCIPRILVLIDEFQVMFTEVDPKSVDIIQGRMRSLAKLARFCGCHMFFTSQSMKGTMPKDTLDQFSLRIALRCSSDTSSDIIGSPIASQIKQKFGYLYTNTNAGESQDSTRLWRTPFASNEVIFNTLDAICQMADERNEINHHAYFYNEDELYPSSALTDWYSENRAVLENEPRLFILGERTGFSLKKSPINFKLKRGDGENLFYYGFEETDFNNLTMTLIDNVLQNPKATVLVNCADPDLFRILDFESWYNKDLLNIAQPMSDVTEWVDSIKDMVTSRKESTSESYDPIYFFALRWDKQNGICRNENYRLMDSWKWVLQEAPTVGIHIVFGAQLFKEVPTNVLTMCNHVICAKGPEDAAYKFMGDSRISKLPNSLGFAVYKYGSTAQKFKIYQHEFKFEAESRELEI